MEKENMQRNFEVIFNNNELAKNKLIDFIINKILDNIDVLGGIIGRDNSSKARGDFNEDDK